MNIKELKELKRDISRLPHLNTVTGLIEDTLVI